MAASSSFLSEEQLTCSICLEVYTEPVSTPCGHNFCKTCITKHWAAKEQHQCPLCNDKFGKGLKLSVNTELRDIVEKFKKDSVKADGASQIKPGQVPCDCCPDNKVRASKTCLVCLVSFCDAHLDPHLRVVAFKSHKLTHPAHKLEEKICKKHHRILEFFCKSDQTRACVLCTEHGDHDTVHLEEAYVDKSARIGTSKESLPKTKQNKGKETTKAAAQSKKKGKGHGKTISVKSKAPYTPSSYSEVPHHFIGCSCFSPAMEVSEGMCIYQVHVKGRAGWELAVFKESLFRRGRSPLIASNGFWGIQPSSNLYTETVVVIVDYTNGLLFFFDADSGAIIYFTSCDFNERLHLYFDPGQPASCAQILQRDIRKILEQKYALLRVIMFIVGVFLVLCILCLDSAGQSSD
ncbi:nuclear factor 7, ovary-like [Kryptolebias marmoratus]|uniref:Nuclear factor 7, ovary-like n=1 Tax=Kryptolebias marmoratus TaxID=37003 RepID=A0A3Q3B803_KRYMA|nr:nuclear factor 7, ovary-like [Kryptolebias marmoratus]